ncbi:MAG: hypothetical protein WBO35_02535, partial [Candidatus Saccharimonadales bacterium]
DGSNSNALGQPRKESVVKTGFFLGFGQASNLGLEILRSKRSYSLVRRSKRSTERISFFLASERRRQSRCLGLTTVSILTSVILAGFYLAKILTKVG